MKHIVNCLICNKTKEINEVAFKRSKSGNFFCGNKHMLKWKVQRNKELRKNKIIEEKQRKELYKDLIKLLSYLRDCQQCGRRFIRPSKAHNKITCSPQCAKIFHVKTRQIRRNTPEGKIKEQERKKIYFQKHGEILKAKNREKYNNDHKGIKTRRRIRNKYFRIGNLIKSEVLHQPSYGSKNLWDGIGEWARNTNVCLDCGTNIYRHQSRGVCTSCYDRSRWENLSPEEREKKLAQRKRRYHETKNSQSLTQKRKEAIRFIEKARDNKIPITNTIKNLLNNLDNDNFDMMVDRYKTEPIQLEIPTDNYDGLSVDQDGFVSIKKNKYGKEI